MRTLNSLKNFSTGIGINLMSNLFNFISRTIFINTLGTSYLGINGLLTNVLSMLSLAELGIGSAINFSLYKPLAEKDNQKIALLMKFYKQAYRVIGLVVLVLGLVLMQFLDVLVKDPGNVENLKLIFLIYVINTSYSYFMTYKITLINADQNGYKLATINIVFNAINTILQIAALVLFKNYILYLLTNMFVLLLQRIYTNRKIDKLYPILNEKVEGKLSKEELKIIIKNVKAMMFHKIGDYCINGTDNMIISTFISVSVVGLYSNYAMIISIITGIIMMFFNSITASMGNLIATEMEERKLEIFKVINFIGFWVYGFSAVCLYNLLNPFIELWIGKEFLISQNIVIIVILNYYLTGMRVPVHSVKAAAGLYDEDKFIPIIQSIVNLITSIILVQKLGLAGVFLGTLISSLVLPCWHRPYIIYKHVFKMSPKEYYKTYSIYAIVLICICLLISKIISLLFPTVTIISFIFMMIICTIIPNIIIVALFYRSYEFRYLLSTLSNIMEGALAKCKRKLV